MGLGLPSEYDVVIIVAAAIDSFVATHCQSDTGNRAPSNGTRVVFVWCRGVRVAVS